MGALAMRTGEDQAMENYLSGSARAFEDLYSALAPRLLACLRAYTHDEAMAEDLMQQTFLQIYCSRERFVRGSSLRPWAMTIARRLALDVLRRNRQEARLGRDHAPHPLDRADHILEARQLCGQLERGLTKLSQSERVAFELVRGEGLSVIEAASRLGISVNAVKVRNHRARRTLLRHIAA
jgi:RNA polymerase sigma-70 factor (ECF subfamily)